jgi:hypothetical protein
MTSEQPGHSDREYFIAVINERDKRYADLRAADGKAIDAALSAAKEAVAAALAAAERAVLKAEFAAEKRFDAVNEFRGQLADQASKLMPRTEAEIRLSNLENAVNIIRGRSKGISDGMGALGVIAGVIIALGGVLVAVFK